LPELGVNAAVFRYQDILIDNTIEFKIEDMVLKLPHPGALAFHKLLTRSRRLPKSKGKKDKEQAISLLNQLLKRDDRKTISIYRELSQKRLLKINRELSEHKDIIKRLNV